MLKKYSKKGLEKRKEERKGFADFYKKHIGIIKEQKLNCQECGQKLHGHVSEVAHVLHKGTFKSVATLDENIVYLCGMNSLNQCHTNFDNFSNEKVKEMFVFPEICRIFGNIENQVTEKISYKIYERYSRD